MGILLMVNFFFLSRDLKKCASWHGDKHLHKMVTEYAQILSTAWHYSVHGQKCELKKPCDCRLKTAIPKGVYKVAHRKHPTVLWCKSSIKHFNAVLELAGHLADERRVRNELFVKRGDKPRYTPFHKSEQALSALKNNPPSLPDVGWSDPPLAMPEPYKKLRVDAVEAYRLYYAGHKVQVAKLKWDPAEEPEWLAEYKKRITPEIQEAIDLSLAEIKKKKKRLLEKKGLESGQMKTFNKVKKKRKIVQKRARRNSNINKESVKKSKINKESIKKSKNNKESVKKNKINKESVKKNKNNKESVKKNNIKKEIKRRSLRLFLKSKNK